MATVGELLRAFAGLAVLPLLLSAQQGPPEFHQRRATLSDGETLLYLVYEPRELDTAARYPLVVYLHGSCGVCTTLERIMRESGLRMWHGYDRNEQREPTFLFAPAGGRGGWTSDARREGMFALIDGLLDEFPIDRQRIYIMGFSMGAYGTWNYLQARPGFFAAANPQAIGGGEVDAEIVKDTPIWATIGVDDNAGRVDQLTANISRIRAANGDPRGAATWVTGVNPRFSVFPDTNHGGAQGRTQQIPGFLDWFYSQVNDGNAAPNVRFIRPVPSRAPYGSTIGMTASATDSDGSIDRVEFSLDGGAAFVDREAPYEHELEGVADGVHTLRARAVDNGGKSRTAEVAVIVRSAAVGGR